MCGFLTEAQCVNSVTRGVCHTQSWDKSHHSQFKQTPSPSEIEQKYSVNHKNCVTILHTLVPLGNRNTSGCKVRPFLWGFLTALEPSTIQTIVQNPPLLQLQQFFLDKEHCNSRVEMQIHSLPPKYPPWFLGCLGRGWLWTQQSLEVLALPWAGADSREKGQVLSTGCWFLLLQQKCLFPVKV